MKAWIFILIAVVLQTFWGMVLKILNFQMLWTYLTTGNVLNMDFLSHLWPVVAYLTLGLGTAAALSIAYKLLPLSIVNATWISLTLVLQVLVDIVFYGFNMKILQFIFIAIILAGIVIMKFSNPKSFQQ